MSEECRTAEKGDRVLVGHQDADETRIVWERRGPAVIVEYSFDYEEDDDTITRMSEMLSYHCSELVWDANEQAWRVT